MIQINHRRGTQQSVLRSSDETGVPDDPAQPRQILIAAIAEAMRARRLNQVQTARLCGTDQPTLSKILRGRTASVTLDKLLTWLVCLGCTVDIRVALGNTAGKGLLSASTRANEEAGA